MLTTPLIVLVAVLFFLLVLSVVVFYYKKISHQLSLFQTELSSNQLFIDELQLRLSAEVDKQQKQSEELKDLGLENQQVTKQLEHRIKVIQQQQTQLEQLISQIEQQQPEDKLYSRASKLVELGADIEEIMRECDIPKAEAEMLISIHRNRIQS